LHGIAPKGPTPWIKSVVGGSDDHSGINPGATWTEFDLGQLAASANSLVDAIRAGSSRPAGAHGGPVTIAHSILKLLHEGSTHRPASRSSAARSIGVGRPMQSLLRLVFDNEAQTVGDKVLFQVRLYMHRMKQMRNSESPGKPFEEVLETQVYLMLDDPRFRAALNSAATMDDRIFLVVKTLINRIFAHYVTGLRNADSLNIVTMIKESVALLSSNLFVSLPYLLAFMQQSADCQIARDVRQAFRVDEPQKIALITDTYFDVNGVSNSIRRMIREAVRRDIEFTVVTCVSAEDLERHMFDPVTRQYVDSGRLKVFTSIANLGFPQYDGLQICFPPMLDLLKYLQEGGFTKIQLSTPGVIGIAGLIAAKLLQIETAATYHTSIPEYVENYTKDVSLEAIAWKYMLFFYHSVDEVLVPSKFVAKLLHKRGLRNRKLLILDRWVDVDRFHPRNHSADYWTNFGIRGDVVKFVYVGRVAVEKNLHILAQAFAKLVGGGANAHMIIIGDGPYRSALASQFAELPATFTGYLLGEELATALASSDVKVFPSTTDTWGNAPLEAQASGLPVIVTDIGGPAELMRHDVTGLMVRGNDVRSLHDAMLQLMNPLVRQKLGRQAREFAESNRVDEPFTAVLDSDVYRRQLRERKRMQEKLDSQNALQAQAVIVTSSEQAANQQFDVARNLTVVHTSGAAE
jgi:glycosyltransferase involved in cell wall biosynthesis